MVICKLIILFVDVPVFVWFRRLVAGRSSLVPGFNLSSAHVEFLVDIVALGQVSLRVIRFCAL